MPEPAATVVIVTKDRSEEAVRVVGSAVAQQPAIEVPLIDDGSSDRIAEAVAAAHLDVRVQRFRLGRSEPISHFASPKRDFDRIWFYECRNDVLFAWHNVPFPDLLAQLGRTIARMLWLGRGVRRTRLFGRGLLTGFRDALGDRRGRRPVARSVWRLYRQLGNRPTRLEQIVSLLPQADT